MKTTQINDFTVAHKHFESDIVNARIIVNAGSQQETEKEYGVAHYLEHMFFKGTKKRHYKEINKITSRLGDVNAYTSTDKTVYTMTFLKDDLKEAVGILGEMVFEPAFPQEEFDKEKTVILEEAQMYLDEPHSYFFSQLSNTLFGEVGHPVIGSLESIKSLQLEQLTAFRQKLYHPENMLISVTGGVKENEVYDVLSNVLPKDVKAGDKSSPIPETMNFDSEHFHHASKQALFAMCFKGPGNQGFWEGGYIHSILSNGLGGGMHSLLFDRLREELGLCYSTGASCQLFTPQYGAFITYVLLEEKNIDMAKEEMQNVINQVKENGLTEEILEVSKKNCLFTLAQRFESGTAYNSMMGDSYFANNKTFIEYDERRKMIDKITNKDIIACANEIFNGPMKFAQMTQG